MQTYIRRYKKITRYNGIGRNTKQNQLFDD